MKYIRPVKCFTDSLLLKATIEISSVKNSSLKQIRHRYFTITCSYFSSSFSSSVFPSDPYYLMSCLSSLRPSLLHSSVCSGLPYLEDLPPHPKEFHPLYGSLILFNGKWNAGRSSFHGHHMTLWHFSPEVCDLYQGAEPSVASANYWPSPRELISQPHSQRPLSRHLGN